MNTNDDYEIVEELPLEEPETAAPEDDYEIVEEMTEEEYDWERSVPERWPPPANPTRREWAALREAFAGDPLAFIGDAAIREELRGNLANFMNPAEEEKKFALAAYFSNMRKQDLKFCYSNLDSLIRKYNNSSRPQSVEAAYNEIAAVFNPKLRKPDLEERVLSGAAAGTGRAAKKAYDTAGFLAKIWAEGSAASMKAELLGRGQDGAAALIRDPREAGAIAEQGIRGVYDRHYRETAEHYAERMALPDDWMTSSESLSDWVGNAVVATVSYIPELAAQSGIAVAGGITPLAFVFGVDGYYQIRDDYPEMSEAQAVGYGVGVGLINGLGEKVTLGIIDGKVTRKVAEEGIRKGVLAAAKHFGWNMAREGAAEGIEEFAQNILDISMGLRGDTAGWTGEDYRRELFRGVPESAFIGSVSAAPFAEASRRNYRALAVRRETERAALENEIETLKAVKEPTEEQELMLDRLQEIADAGNVADIEIVARRIAELDAVRRIEKERGIDEKSSEQTAREEADDPEFREIDAAAWEGATRQEVRRAAEAGKHRRAVSRLPHNPEETIEAVADVSRRFPGIRFHIARNPQDYPAAVTAEAERRFGGKRVPRAFLFQDEIWIDASRVRPSRVPAMILHEVAGHKGLRTLFPDDAKLNAILDKVYREHAGEEAFDRLAELHFPDRVRPGEADPESGEPGAPFVALETDRERRLVAEEYVAILAESDSPRPGWWKQFLQSIRMWIADHLPLTREFRMTDREIEILIARSVRVERRRRGRGGVFTPGAQEPGAGDAGSIRFALNAKGETIFGIAGRPGNLTAREIIEDSSIGADTPVLTSEGSEAWGEITPGMAAAAPELGLEALPIKMLKGRHRGQHAGFGLAHVHEQHGAELEARGYDLAEYLTGIFSRPNRIYASKRGENIRLELVTKSMPRNIGVLELRKEDGFYSVVTAFPMGERRKARGELIWQYSVPKHNPASSEPNPLEPLSADKAASAARTSGTKSDTNITPSGEKSSESGDESIRFSVAPVWTGSAADYDRPDLHYIGTGEGAQVYGWGLYGSSSEKVARWYARTDAERKNRARILLDGKEPDPEWYDKTDLSGEPTEFEIENTVLEDVRGRKGSISGTLEYYRIQMNKPTTARENPEFYRLCREWLEKNKDRISYIPENDDLSGRRNLYRQTFFAGREENLLDWDKPVAEEQRKKITEQLKKEGLFLDGDPDRASADYRELKRKQNSGEEVSPEKFEAAYNKAARLHAQRNVIGKTINGDIPSGSMAYENLEEILGSPKAASEFLHRAGIDGITYVGDSSGVRNYVAFSDRDIRVDEHIRFALSEYSDAEQRDFIDLLKPFVGTFMTRSDAEAARYLARFGVDIPEADVHAFARFATLENQKKARERGRAERDKWLYETHPEYAFMIDRNGPDFRIDPGPAHKGEEFTGTFIGRGKKYRGTPIDELAKEFAARHNIDPQQAEERLLDFFRNLKKPDLYHEYAEWKKQRQAFDNPDAAKNAEEWEALQYEIAEQQIVDLADSSEPIDRAWISAHRPAYRILYDRLFPGRKAPHIPGKTELEAMNAALKAQGDKAAAIAETWKEARKVLGEEYRKKLAELRDAVQKRYTDMRKLQNLAKEFAFSHLAPEYRSKFIGRILRIADYSTAHTQKHPEGRRTDEFNKLLADMSEESGRRRRDAAIAEIRRMLDANRTRRTRKNVPFSPMGERQPALDRIAQIVRMDPETVNANLLYLTAEKSNAVEAFEALPESAADGDAERDAAAARIERIDRELFYFNHFGALALKKPDEAVKNMRALRKFIREGRIEFEEKSLADRARFREERENLRREMTGGNLDVPADNELDRTVSPVADFLWKSESINRMLDVLSRSDDLLALDGSAHGKLINMVCDSSKKEQTNLNEMQKWFDKTLKELGVGNLVDKGRFLNDSMRVEKTGIAIKQYARTVKTERAARTGSGESYSDRSAGRPRITAAVHVEHARKMLEEAGNGREISAYYPVHGVELHKKAREELKAAGIRTGRVFSIFGDAAGNLRVYTENEAGETVGHDLPESLLPSLAECSPFPVDGFTRDAAREMIFEYDAGGGREALVRGRGDDVDDAAFEAFLASGGSRAKIDLVAPDPEAAARDAELSLSPGAAMQLVLEWEQKRYRPVMEWNGYSEQTIEEIKAWLDKKNPAYLKMAYAMRDFLAAQRPALDRAVFERYGVHLPETENFFYADFSGSVADNVRDPGFGNPAGGMTVSANFLTARKFHLLPPSTNTNAITLFLFKQLEQNHFIAWNQTIRELRAVYSDRAVQNTVVAQFGQAAWNNLRDKIELLAANGRTPDGAEKFYRSFFKTWAPANIALNASSVLKQAAGGVAYANYVPVTDLVRYLPEANPFNSDYREWLRFALRSDYLANRRAGGLDPNLAGLLNFTRRGGKTSSVSDAFTRGMLWPTLASDQATAVTWGYAAFRSFEVQALKRGMSQKQAFDAARRMWERATDETQQSGALKDANHFSASPGLWRYLTTFRTNPMQTAALEIDAIRKVLLDPKNKRNWKTLGRRMAVNHLYTTTLMNLVSSAMRHGINIGDYWEDWPDYVAGWLFGSFDSIWLFGQGAMMLYRGFAGDPFASEMSAVPLMSDLARDAAVARKAWNKGPGEVDVIDYMKSAGDLLMSAGPAQTRALGMGLYALARQAKRVRKWITGE